MSKKYFEYKDDKSSKFYEISSTGKTVTIRFGKIGTDGQITIKELASPAEAKVQVEKLILEKKKKGYEERENSKKNRSEKETLKFFIDHNKAVDADVIKWLIKIDINNCIPFVNQIRCDLDGLNYSFLSIDEGSFVAAEIYNFAAIAGDEKDEFLLCYTAEVEINLEGNNEFIKALKYSKYHVEVLLGFMNKKRKILEGCYEPVTDYPVRIQILK